MGRDLCETFEEARKVFETADNTLGENLSRLCFEGPEELLTDTVNAQPAILVHSVAVLKIITSRVGNKLISPAFVAGHSLGEYSALVAAGALDFADAVRLVRSRGMAMRHAGEERPGAMAAILGLDEEKLGQVCEEAGAVHVANINAPGQIVISGDKGALEKALVLAKQAGAKRAIKLAVSIAAHSELMRSAIDVYTPAVNSTTIKPMKVSVISNVEALPLESEDAVRGEMLAQLTHPVQWVKTIEYMSKSGVVQFYELGPKDVLTGLVRRIVPGAEAASLGDPAGLNTFVTGTAG